MRTIPKRDMEDKSSRIKINILPPMMVNMYTQKNTRMSMLPTAGIVSIIKSRNLSHISIEYDGVTVNRSNKSMHISHTS